MAIPDTMGSLEELSGYIAKSVPPVCDALGIGKSFCFGENMTINNQFTEPQQTICVATNVVRPDKTGNAAYFHLLQTQFPVSNKSLPDFRFRIYRAFPDSKI